MEEKKIVFSENIIFRKHLLFIQKQRNLNIYAFPFQWKAPFLFRAVRGGLWRRHEAGYGY